MAFALPPITTTPEGAMRRVGFEMEFTGLNLNQVVESVAQTFGGAPASKNRFVRRVLGTEFGDFSMVFDVMFFKSQKYLAYMRMLGVEDASAVYVAEDIMEGLVSTLLPYEVVTPPLPMDRMQVVETLREKLRAAGAKGTNRFVLYAFGLHLNVEAWSLEVADLTRLMRAFLLLETWIAERSEVSLTRKLSHFIDPFPAEYAALVLAPEYAPDMAGFMADYLRHNPTRNRSLDLLPLLATIDQELVMSFPVEREMIKPRPAFHYRLPNSRVDEPEWTIGSEWAYWVEVERLAADAQGLEELMEAWRNQPSFPFNLFQESWPRTVQAWMDARRASA